MTGRLRGRRLIALLLCMALLGCVPTRRGLVPLPRHAQDVLKSTLPVVKIGLVAPFEQRYRTLGYEVLYAVKWAVGQRNAQGGAAGVMVELVALNDNHRALESMSRAEELGVDLDVMGAIGPFFDEALRASAATYGEASLAVVVPTPCLPEVTGFPGVYCLAGRVEDVAEALADRLPVGAQVTLLVGEGPAMGDTLASMVHSVVDLTQAGPTHDRADVYLYDGDVLSAAEALVALRQAGIDAPLLGGPALARTQLPQIAGGAAAGACYAIVGPLLADLSADSAFARGYREFSGSTPGPWAALAHDATVLLLDAIERAVRADGTVSRAGVRRELEATVGPGGQMVFHDGLRQHVSPMVYCYDGGEPYPGHIVDWAGPDRGD